jgi:DNA-binding FadR family transcriptional regulator
MIMNGAPVAVPASSAAANAPDAAGARPAASSATGDGANASSPADDGANVGLTTAAARTVLAPIGDPAGLADAVAQRLSEAIRLGLLLDRERLPPEPKLAEQLGVSTVTLREALAMLREQGLVTTRRGRGGGTFVAAPDLARELVRRLHTFSTEQLRDLGDHRAAVFGMSARLAAERALPSEVAGLASQLDRLRAAATASERRRASTQFAVAVAAAAQSARLVREEQRLTAEVGDLLWLQTTEADHDAATAARARLVDAIGRRDAVAAGHIAELQVLAETTRLIALRQRGYAADQDAATALDDVGASIDRLSSMLADLGAEFAALHAGVGDVGLGRDSIGRDDLSALRPAIFRALAEHRGLAAGAGVITAPGVLGDAPLWLEWWWITAADTPERLRVNLDPAAPDFYDYTTAEWYTAAEGSERPQLVGPYVDHFCTGEYTITLSLPVRAAGRFLGVAAADMLVSSLEHRVLPVLLAAAGPMALTSADGRIIASAAPRWPPGMRAPAAGTPALRAWRLTELDECLGGREEK